MPMMSFAEALEHARANYAGRLRGILMGNGFSRAYNNDIFSYNSLADEALLPGLSVTKEELFAGLDTRNFESILEKLGIAVTVEELYGGDSGLIERIKADRKLVRRGLANVIAARHPAVSTVMDDDEVLHARQFLSNFQYFYTLNYDLLLYWVMSRHLGPSVNANDGFEWPTPAQTGRLLWKLNPSATQHVFYLHGALHLFIESKKVRKLSYSSGGPIIASVRNRLDNGDLPLIVTEGTRSEKEVRIERSAYLRHSLRRFAAFSGVLFVYGVSMAPNDDHILETLEVEESQVDALYVGIRNGGSASTRRLKNRAEEIVDRRAAAGKPIELVYFDAGSANVWRH